MNKMDNGFVDSQARLRSSLIASHDGEPETDVRSLQRFGIAVMQSANTIIITNRQGEIIFANPKFEQVTGYTIAEVVGKNPRLMQSGEQTKEFYKELWEQILSGKVWAGEFKNKRKDGSFYWESATITPLKDARGQIVEFLAIKEDITERKLMEEKLERTLQEMEAVLWEQKMLNRDLEKEIERRKNVESELKLQKDLLEELNTSLESQVAAELALNREKDEMMLRQSRHAAMGEMIGNIAHQWRQPLNTIGLMIYDLADAFRYGELTESYMKKSETEIKAVLAHMSQTIDDFRNFFKPNKEKQVFNLASVVKTSVSFVDATLRNNGILLIQEIDEELDLYGYSNEFAQVMLNMVSNARDVMIERKVKKPVIRISGQRKQDKALVSVIDNGGGIPPQIIHKIFDPYFTTKEQGKGTGVGLYMSRNIIERNMGGELRAENIKCGAKFSIILPLCT